MTQLQEVLDFVRTATSAGIDILQVTLPSAAKADFEALDKGYKYTPFVIGKIDFGPNGTKGQPELYLQTALVEVALSKSSGGFRDFGDVPADPVRVEEAEIRELLLRSGLESYDFRIEQKIDVFTVMVVTRLDRLRRFDSNLQYACPRLVGQSLPDTATLSFWPLKDEEWSGAREAVTRLRQAAREDVRSAFREELDKLNARSGHLRVEITKKVGQFPQSLPLETTAKPYFDFLLQDLAEFGYSLKDIGLSGAGEHTLYCTLKLEDHGRG